MLPREEEVGSESAGGGGRWVNLELEVLGLGPHIPELCGDKALKEVG